MSDISTTNTELPPAPEGLSPRAVLLWDRIAEDFELREDELIVLHEACKALSRIEVMEAALAGEDLIVMGSMKQKVVNPLIPEIRQTSQLLAQHLARLKLDGIGSEPESGFSFMYSPASQRGSSAARSRYKERV